MDAAVAGLVSLMALVVPPGRTHFSVVPVEAQTEDTRWSSFYQSHVRQETSDEGLARYQVVAAAIVDGVTRALCVDYRGQHRSDCVPVAGASSWTWSEAVGMTVAVATYESGFREDVQMGRGWSKCSTKKDAIKYRCTPDDAGGRGKGPGKERCFMQIHPSMGGDDSLVGSPEAYERCFYKGFSMLAQARAYCGWSVKKPQQSFEGRLPSWHYTTVSMYWSGAFCLAVTNPKVKQRAELGMRLIPQVNKIVKEVS